MASDEKKPPRDPGSSNIQKDGAKKGAQSARDPGVSSRIAHADIDSDD